MAAGMATQPQAKNATPCRYVCGIEETKTGTLRTWTDDSY
jgi:hypothetical protein